MTGEILCLGISHHQTPVELREKVVFTREKLEQALLLLKEQPNINEGLILSTCNRVELYAHSNNLHAFESLERFLTCFHELPSATLTPHLYRLRGHDAAEQFFRVASSLDSLVLGEAQILGQVKDAIAIARQAKTVGPHLNLMLNHALATAKRIRTETQIARHSISISHIAVELIENVFSTINSRNTLLVGAGAMAEVAAKCLSEKGAKLKIANRTKTHAETLSRVFNAPCYELQELDNLLVECDIVMTSTNAVGYLISKAKVKAAMRKRRYRPIFFVDIAVPRNIDPAVSTIDGAYLYNIDDLSQIAHNRMSLREEHGAKAQLILAEEMQRFKVRHGERRVAPIIIELRARCHEMADYEVNQLLASLAEKTDPHDERAIRQMAHSIVNKLLHAPIQDIKKQAQEQIPPHSHSHSSSHPHRSD